MDTAGEGEGGMNSQSSIDLCVLHVKNGVSGKPLHSSGGSAWLSVRTKTHAMGREREAHQGESIFIIRTDSLYRTVETNTIL